MTPTHLTMLQSTKADVTALYDVPIEDTADRLAVMQHKETTTYHPIDYLNCPPTPISPVEQEHHRQSRSNMCQWSYQLIDIFRLSRHAVLRSMSYLDRLLASSHPRSQRCVMGDKREYQLAAMTTLYISIKVHEHKSMDASLLVQISKGCYTTQEILAMENDILEALQWKVNGPTSQEFVSLLLGTLEPHLYRWDFNTLGSMLDVTTFQCEMASNDYDLSICCKPSEVALAAILNSLEGMGEESMTEEAKYQYLTRLCQMLMLPMSAALDMGRVGYIQVRLQSLFCHNSGGNTLLDEEKKMPSISQEKMSSSPSTTGRRESSTSIIGGSYEMDGIAQCYEVKQACEKCSSPVSARVTPPGGSRRLQEYCR